VVWGRQAPPAKCFVARCSEPSAKQAERSGKRGALSTALGLSVRRPAIAGNKALGRRCCRPHTPRFPLCSAYHAEGSLARATKRLACGTCRPSGYGSGSSHLPSASLLAVTSLQQDKPSAAECGSVGRHPLLRLKKLKVGYKAVTITVPRGQGAWPSVSGRRRRHSPRQSGGLGATPPITFICRSSN